MSELSATEAAAKFLRQENDALRKRVHELEEKASKNLDNLNSMHTYGASQHQTTMDLREKVGAWEWFYENYKVRLSRELEKEFRCRVWGDTTGPGTWDEMVHDYFANTVTAALVKAYRAEVME